ncbi:MAG: surface-adhesin E family protein [Caulobacteraceae bacterium]
MKHGYLEAFGAFSAAAITVLAIGSRSLAAPSYVPPDSSITPDAKTADAGANYFLVVNGSQSYVFIDASRIKKDAREIAQAWCWTVYEGPAVAIHHKKFQVLLYNFDCNGGRIGISKIVAYSFSGNVIMTWESRFNDWNTIVPNSIGEEMKHVACMNPGELDSYYANYYEETPREAADNLYKLLHSVPHKRESARPGRDD